ncbi:MAG TPA: AAA family ATPase [Leptolyngbyaceae cyanobacterium]
MYLEKVCVPDFRALQNVEICFERELKPSIFPLGSLNGGGKSTLLQLIFVLLHCSTHPDRIVFLKNFLNGFKIDTKSNKRILATLDIWEGNKTIQLEFFTCNYTFIQTLWNDDSLSKKDYKDIYDIYISAYNRLRELNAEIVSLGTNISIIDKIHTQLISLSKTENYQENYYTLQSIKHQLQKYILSDYAKYQPDYLNLLTSLSNIQTKPNGSSEDVDILMSITREVLTKLQLNLDNVNKKIKQVEYYEEFFIDVFKKNNMIYVCENLPNFQEQEAKETLMCQFKNIEINEGVSFLQKISEKIFFAAHVSQVFLFLSPDSRKSLFKTQAKEKLDENDYYTQIRKGKPKLPGFFTYDFMAVDILIDSFKKARDMDFLKAIETGEYGDNYKRLLEELNDVLSNKKININKDLSGVTFKVNTDDIELYPEDLSHGELKRLCLYMWMKHHQIENSIVLMDEIEIAFHPDWQYQIVRDIEEWSPTNQYILATHSYELCQAVTPAHVKELEPKLRKNPK